MISSVDPEMSTKMLRNLGEKLVAKLPVTTSGYSMVTFACLDDAFSEFFKLEASPEEELKKKRRKKGTKKWKKMKSLKWFM